MSLFDENMNQNKHNQSNKNVRKKTKTHKSNHPFPSTSPNIEPQASKLHQNKIKCSLFFFFSPFFIQFHYCIHHLMGLEIKVYLMILVFPTEERNRERERERERVGYEIFFFFFGKNTLSSLEISQNNIFTLKFNKCKQ